MSFQKGDLKTEDIKNASHYVFTSVVHVVHSGSWYAVVSPLTVHGHLVPILLRGHWAEAHVGEAGEWSTTKCSNPVNA